MVGDELFTRVGKLGREVQQAGAGLIFSYWEIKRKYSHAELDRGELFLPRIAFTHLAGEEYGTRYQESTECAQEGFEVKFADSDHSNPIVVSRWLPCGLCSPQVTLLRVPFGLLAKSRPIQRLWGGELVISHQLSQLIVDERLTGGALYPIRNLKSAPISPLVLSNPAGSRLFELARAVGLNPEQFEFWRWFYADAPKELLDEFLAEQNECYPDAIAFSGFWQLLPHSHPLDVSDSTRFGQDPFDMSAARSFRCKSGVIAGGRLLSSLSVLGSSWDGSDICHTDVFIGGRQGLFRPHRLLVVSRRFVEAMKEAGIRLDCEIVDVV